MSEITATYNEDSQIISLVIDGKPHIVNKDHVSFTRILNALIDGEEDKIPKLLDLNKAISDFSDGRVTVQDGIVFLDNLAVEDSLSRRLVSMIRLGINVKPLCRFIENLYKNPANHSVNRLYAFMEACDMPITKDGKLLAYRSVRSNFWDSHTGKTTFCKPYDKFNDSDTFNLGTHNGCLTEIVNGKTVCSMPRNQVDDDHDRTCSNGLHVCSQKYGKFSDILLLVSVDPADVVSVPNEYGNAKMRVSKFTVEEIVEGFEDWEDTPVYDNVDDEEYDEEDYITPKSDADNEMIDNIFFRD
jgi:hypothetical protein